MLKDPETGDASFEAFSCEVEPERDAVRVRAIGALDIAGVPVLRAQIDELLAVGFRCLVVDLRELHFMDSTGLRLMLELDAEARRDGFSVAFVQGPPAVQRVFELTGTETLLPFVDA